MCNYILFLDDSVFYKATSHVASSSTVIIVFLQVGVHGSPSDFFGLPVLVKDTVASLETVKDKLHAEVAVEAARIKSAVDYIDGSVVQRSNHSHTLVFYCIER